MGPEILGAPGLHNLVRTMVMVTKGWADSPTAVSDSTVSRGTTGG
jgi:hypothetical protein